MNNEQRIGDSYLRKLLVQFIKFAGVGAIGTACHYATLIFLVQSIGVSPVIGSTCGFVVGALVNYYLNYTYTFDSKKSHKEAMTKFFVVAFFGMGMNAAIMYSVLRLLELNYIIAQFIATGVVLASNFALNRIWTFGKAEEN